MEFATIGSALASRRKSLKIDQARAAAIIGMSRTTFSSYERDLQRPSAEVLPSLAQFLEISLDDILTLYGGTCIEALRPSLERFLATQEGGNVRSSAGEAGVRAGVDVSDSGSSGQPFETEMVIVDAPAASPVLVGAGDLSRFDGAGEVSDPHDVGDVEGVVDVVDLRSSETASKGSSVSIFANELSHEQPATVTAASFSSAARHENVKAVKGKSGKKKKGKKGKRPKS